MPGILARASSLAKSRLLHPPAGWAKGFLLHLPNYYIVGLRSLP